MTRRQRETEAWPWDDPDDAELYRAAVRGCLWDAEFYQYYGLRLYLSPDALQEAAHRGDFAALVHDSARAQYAHYREAVQRVHELRGRLAAARQPTGGGLLVAVGAAAALVGLVWLVVDLWALDAGPAGWGYAVPLAALGPAAWPGLRRRVENLVGAVCLRVALRVWERRQEDRRLLWRWTMVWNGIRPQMHRAARDMLGDEWDQLLTAASDDWLRVVQDPALVVSTAAQQQLEGMMNRIDGGTIAVCGPRGAGKSTLLRACSVDQVTEPRDLSVFVSTPAEYSPHEFLLALFGEVCSRYLTRFGDAGPDVGLFQRVRRRTIARSVLRTLGRSARLVVALTALTAGLYQCFVWLRGRFTSPVDLARLRRDGLDLFDSAAALWRAHPWAPGLLLVLAGLYLLPSLRRRAAEPASLTDECRRLLLRLRTVQSTTSGTTLTLPQVLGAGAGATRATAVSSLPFTFPELVSEFRRVVADIAEEVGRDGIRLVIGVDELDRVGDTVTARRFLGQIKAVFGIRNVYYLVSVAEDVGAAFVRRGLQYRDATDSSLDDILYLPPRTTEESRGILARRAPHLTPPFVLLAHALSGGIPRDLIRYARRLSEAQRNLGHPELEDVTHHLVREELAGTLDGFRALLALEDAGRPESGPLLHQLHVMVRMLHTGDDVTEETVQARLQDLADSLVPVLAAPCPQPVVAAEPDAPDLGQAALWREAMACIYFALTLMQIFGRPDFENRRERARGKGAHGELERLAEARQELAISPFSTHTILDGIRTAWDLPALLVQPPVLPPAPPSQ
ncbi:hypothetical protein [Streptomyces sp. NPDC003023]|uniref:hypothetical protein n=1 Tax=Streptomyces sp. NPDC003023 TaxID=3364675 RepID=UPI0036893496